ncbi:MAG: Asp-tRNA(Asn)/Glu-tRNA(Gln) amidotransferase subunit GatC [Verrucomicrobia bacterium]|nr:Asp-tRNA(Asn)/Glu-tRNA(Gln) amidotransferase subunit GatC [Verrucomicrobiota bacterium]
MSTPEIDVRYVAQLARLALTEEETARYQTQLGQILEYVAALQEVDVEGVEPTAHPGGLQNVLREDEVAESFTATQALANAPRAANGLFMVPKVIE